MYNVVNPNGFNCQSRSAIFAFTCYKLLAQLYVANFVCVRVRVCECVFDKPITELCVVQCINTSIPHIQTYLYKYLLYYLWILLTSNDFAKVAFQICLVRKLALSLLNVVVEWKAFGDFPCPFLPLSFPSNHSQLIRLH